MLNQESLKSFLKAISERVPTIVSTDETALMRRRFICDVLVSISKLVERMDDLVESGLTPEEIVARMEDISAEVGPELAGLRAKAAELFLDFPSMDFLDPGEWWRKGKQHED